MMLREFVCADKRIFVTILNEDKYLYEELVFILVKQGFLEVNSTQNTIPKKLRDFSVVLYSIKRMSKNLKLTLSRVVKLSIFKVYLTLRGSRITGSLILSLKNFIIQRNSREKKIILSTGMISTFEEKLDHSQLPAIVLANRTKLGRIVSDAVGNGLSTIMFPNADMLFIFRPDDQTQSNSEDFTPYPLPYSFIRNSYFTEGLSEKTTAIVVIDCLSHFSDVSIYGREFRAVMENFEFKQISLIYSSPCSNPPRADLSGIVSVGSDEINFSKFHKLREVFGEDSIVLRLSREGLPWLENFTKAARIPYVELSYNGGDSDVGKRKSGLMTLLGNIRKIPVALGSDHTSNESSIHDIQLAETEWREVTEELISRKFH